MSTYPFLEITQSADCFLLRSSSAPLGRGSGIQLAGSVSMPHPGPSPASCEPGGGLPSGLEQMPCRHVASCQGRQHCRGLGQPLSAAKASGGTFRHLLAEW
jgi:hypothetical protein